MFARSVRNRIVKEIRECMTKWYAGDHIHAACLYWAGMTCYWIRTRYRVRAIIQAGSMSWPCVDKDDGMSPTHFSYVFDPDDPASRAALRSGQMPEMHVWAAIPTDKTIIDLTTCYLIQQAKHRANIEWTAPMPPDHLWCRADDLPPGVLYRPAPEATLWAHEKVMRSFPYRAS